MSFLGTASRKLGEAPIPSNLGSDVTMVQKKRLALLAKMGLGPGAKADNLPPRAAPTRVGASGSTSTAEAAGPEGLAGIPPPSQDRKALLVERERRIREQEDQANAKAMQEMQDKQAKKRSSGLQSLGAVEPRKEVTMPLPTPAAFYPSQRAASSGSSKLELRIPMDTAERLRGTHATQTCTCGTVFVPGAKFCSECGAKRPPEPPAPQEDEEDDDSDDEEEAPAQETRVAPGQWKRPAPVQQVSKKKGKKRKKKKDQDDPDDEAVHDEEWEENSDAEEGQEEQVLRMLRDLQEPRIKDPTERARAQARESGKIYKNMVVGTVKGMVSNDYKGFTDADLERRFQLPNANDKNSLMSEEQVLQIINKERGSKNSAATQKRIQREQAEWQEKLKEHKARDSNARFERMVVGRK